MQFDNSQYWTRQRRELVQWLEDRAPSFTEGYVAAVHLLHESPFPARVHLICHLIRDIYRHLPAALGQGSLPTPGQVFPGMALHLANQWKRFPPKEDTKHQNIGASISVSTQVYKAALSIVEKSNEIAAQPKVGGRFALSLFHALDRSEDEFIHTWIIESFNDEYNFFVSRAHLATTINNVPGDEGLKEHFEAFERAFHSLVGPYFSGKEELDAILQETNPESD